MSRMNRQPRQDWAWKQHKPPAPKKMPHPEWYWEESPRLPTESFGLFHKGEVQGMVDAAQHTLITQKAALHLAEDWLKQNDEIEVLEQRIRDQREASPHA